MPSARFLRREIAREKQHGKPDKQDMATHCIKPPPRFPNTLAAAMGRVEPDKARTGHGYRLSRVLLFRRGKLSHGASFKVLDLNRHGLPVSCHFHPHYTCRLPIKLVSFLDRVRIHAPY